MEHFFPGESPLIQKISFNKLLEKYEGQLELGHEHQRQRARAVLAAQEPYPLLRDGFTDPSVLIEHEELVRFILADSFSDLLTENEIKTASAPFSNITFNGSARFRRIIEAAGPDFRLRIRNMPEGLGYILQGIVILGFYYGFKVDFKRPLFYDIPDSQGVMRHYRLLYNADFIELIPTEKARHLDTKDLHELMENFEDHRLWKEKIPPGSFISKGFVISNMFDVTAEHSISQIKSTLIEGTSDLESDAVDNFQETFRSLFNLKNIRVGFTGYNDQTRELFKLVEKDMNSFLLNQAEKNSCVEILQCPKAYRKLMEERAYVALPNLEQTVAAAPGLFPYQLLYDQGIRSAILAPIAHQGKLLGVMELASDHPYELNTFNATKLDDVIPFIASAIKRSMEERENRIDAVIQKECTTVHPSVYWKFREEANHFLNRQSNEERPAFRDIVFGEVYPLFGQVDIKQSSAERNSAIQKDLLIQLSEASLVVNAAQKRMQLPIHGEMLHRIGEFILDVKDTLYTYAEQKVYDFLRDEVDPLFGHFLELGDPELVEAVNRYRSQVDTETGTYYDHRKNYDQSVFTINSELASVIDQSQEQAQRMFPHYFERYKTDGVEHNLFIGQSITPHTPYHESYLGNLRIWQLQVICEMDRRHQQIKPMLPVPMEVASLVLVYSTPLAIRFRMDEKRFDVDGTYNARYEIIKKRIDKSYIKGTNERLTQKGKLSIVYSQKSDEREYLRYLSYLKKLGYVSDQIEVLELDGLQGVNGLKSIRAGIVYDPVRPQHEPLSLEELLRDIQAQ